MEFAGFLSHVCASRKARWKVGCAGVDRSADQCFNGRLGSPARSACPWLPLLQVMLFTAREKVAPTEGSTYLEGVTCSGEAATYLQQKVLPA